MFADFSYLFLFFSYLSDFKFWSENETVTDKDFTKEHLELSSSVVSG